MTRTEELAVKVQRIRELLARQQLGGLLLSSRPNFSWITCGGQSYVFAHADAGVGSVLVTADRLILIADNIELKRLVEEELGELADQFETAEFKWWEPGARSQVIAELTGGASIGVDAGDGGMNVGPALNHLRASLTDAEVDRYVQLGMETGAFLEAVCRRVTPGMSEHDVSALMFDQFTKTAIRVPVYLVAADDRIVTRRHPITTDKQIRDRVMVVVCAERAGLICSATRLVNFCPIDADLRRRHDAVCRVDATAIAGTQIGRGFAEIFKDIQKAYADNGFADEWQLHHQGGSTGYFGRDVFADACCQDQVVNQQAFAWNPSITGTKSEDTMIVTEQGPRLICQPGEDWPCLEIECRGVTWRRADIFVK